MLKRVCDYVAFRSFLLFCKCSIRLHKNGTKLSKVEELAMKTALRAIVGGGLHILINVRPDCEKGPFKIKTHETRSGSLIIH